MRGTLVFIALVIVVFVVGIAIRNKAIDDCKSRGGKPVTHSWFQESYWDPGCVEP